MKFYLWNFKTYSFNDDLSPFNNYYKKYYFNFITLNFLKILMNYIIIELQFLIKKIMKYIILNIKLIPMVHLDNSEINMIIHLKIFILKN